MADKSDCTSTLAKLLDERIVILDGAMGTRIQELGLTEAHYRGAEFRKHTRPLLGCHDVLSITQPGLVASIHRDYIGAGAEVITTNTFRANRRALAGYGIANAVYEINRAAARLASNLRDGLRERTPRFVAGAVSSPDAHVETYREQVRGLLEGGADILLAETVFDTRNGAAALEAFAEGLNEARHSAPVIVSVTVTESGRLPSGETLEEFWNAVGDPAPFAVGINCSVGPWRLGPLLEQLAKLAPATYLACYPNAGLPDPRGRYPDTPDRTASALKDFARNGLLNLVGACCGAGPEHIRRIRDAVAPYAPRKRTESPLS